MTRYYTDLKPSDPDMGRWTVAHVLRGHAASQPGAIGLVAPEEGREFSYAELLEGAERVAGGMRADGAADGDRVVIMAANSSQIRVQLARLRRWRPGRSADQHRLRGRVPPPPGQPGAGRGGR